MAKEEQGESRAPRATEETRGEERRVVRCAACDHALTDENARTEKDGKHRHDFVNPSGLAFRIACYRDAPGCVEIGEAETFWSWFSGYSWRIASCAECAAHLGWSYRGRDDAFFGLIVDRIKT